MASRWLWRGSGRVTNCVHDGGGAAEQIEAAGDEEVDYEEKGEGEDEDEATKEELES